MADAPKKSQFREEAVQHARARWMEGPILLVSPSWTRWAYWILVAAFIFGATYSVFGTIHEYAAGPAVVWATGRVDVTAPTEGVVSSIDILPGQRVEAGALLARFYSAPESAELTRLQHEFDLQLVKTFQDPSDREARDALTSLRAQKELAQARLDQLTIRAPRAGVAGDIRIRAGQRLEAGDMVMTLTAEESEIVIVAMLPGHYRPQLRNGMSMRFEATGYLYAYQEMTIESIDTQAIGPAEVKRYLGQEIFDTVKVDGPVVLVKARSPSRTFRVDDRSFELYHGMSGTVEARVRSESLLIALIPSLRVVLERLKWAT